MKIKTIRKKADIKKAIKILEIIRTKNCQVLSIYIPSEFDMRIIVKQLEEEKSYVRKNISKNKNNILETINYTIEIINSIKTSYKNGCVIFVGRLKKDKFISEVIVPPKDVGIRLYRCDKEFLLHPLKDVI